jgi:rhodanese-related sulfurtransferase
MTQIGVIDANNFVTLLKKNKDLNILDVRTDIEFNNLSLDYPVMHKTLHEINVKKYPKSKKETYILCKAGPRAFKFAEVLAENGHENLIVIDGGMIGCKACGAIVKESNTPTPMEEIMQAVQQSFQQFMIDNS